MNNIDFIYFLKDRLNKELPGFDAQIKMAMKFNSSLFRKFKPSETARKSSVLIILTGKSELSVLFTLRSSKLKHHRGQISFPGGRHENGEQYCETAIRETWEETGILVDKECVIGKLSNLFVPPSDSLIFPYIAYIENITEPKINPDEVDEVFLKQLDLFSLESTKKIVEMNVEGIIVDTPYWDIHPTTKLWGATSMILSELVEIYKEWKYLHQ